MSELTVTIVKLGFLAILWLFVLSTISVVRADLFGARGGAQASAAGRQAGRVKQPKQPKPAKPSRGEPTVAIVVRGATAGAQARLGTAPLTIGRGPECELPVDDEYVSTRHAILRKQGQTWYAEDLGSTNGTFVNETRVSGPTAVGLGGTVRVGKTVIELRK